jgi:hypothetical protein
MKCAGATPAWMLTLQERNTLAIHRANLVVAPYVALRKPRLPRGSLGAVWPIAADRSAY